MFLLWALNGGGLSHSCPGHFTSMEGAPGTHLIGDCVGLRSGLDMTTKRKSPYPCQEWNPGHPVSSWVAVLTELHRLLRTWVLWFIRMWKISSLKISTWRKRDVCEWWKLGFSVLFLVACKLKFRSHGVILVYLWFYKFGIFLVVRTSSPWIVYEKQNAYTILCR